MTEAGSPAFMNRRQFLVRSGTLTGLAALAAMTPGLLTGRAWAKASYAKSLNLVEDTMSGLVAFILPGNDDYSALQGETADGPGGIAAGAVQVLIANLDRYLPAPQVGLGGLDLGIPGLETIPLSAAVASLLDAVALIVDPLAMDPLTGGGVSLSPFAHLSSAQKAQVFAQLEALHAPDDILPEPFTQVSGNASFVVGILPAYTGFLVGNEAGVYDDTTRSLTSRPVSWQISGYQPNGPVEGWDELKGYYKGRKAAKP